MTLQAYLRHRRAFEIAFWMIFITIQCTANSVVAGIDAIRRDLGFASWEPWAWEFSSGIVWLALIPLMLAFDRRFPLVRPVVRRNLAWHLLFTLPLSLAHVLGMIALRELVYAAMGGDYRFDNLPDEFFYEYLKDFRSYAGILATFYLYRFVLRRWQGEAQFLAEGREEEPPEPVTDRFLVKKLGREFLVKVDDIDWVESSGNYVTLHVGERLYPLRETMSGIEQKLEDRGFARVHRGAILNLDRVKEIEPFDTGDARAHLVNGGAVPVSRRYRQVLKERLR